MKKLLLAMMMLVGATLAYSQDTIPHKNSFSMNVTQLINSCLRLNYEHFFKNKNSFVINAGVIMRSEAYEQYSGGTCELQYHINSPLTVVLKRGIIYFAPYAGFQYLEHSNDYPYSGGARYSDYTTATAGCLFGVRTNLTSKFFFDLNVGGGFKYTITNSTSTGDYYYDQLGTQQLGYSGVYPRANVLLGINF